MNSNTLRGWLGSTAKAVDPRSLSPLKSKAPDTNIWGLIGQHNGLTYEMIETAVIEPLVTAWGLPDSLLLPTDGDASHVLERWATLKSIPVRFISCDWHSLGRSAARVRDTTIERGATHMILLQGPRSNTLTGLAARLKRRGRPVGLSERPGSKIVV